MSEFVQAKLEESNIANIGSEEDHALRKQAAQTDTNIWPCGQEEGLEIWRVENKRTDADTPDFGVARWPKEEYGRFFKGDSYVVLKSYKEKGSDKMLYNVHFWLGESSSQDEIGVAAYKAVEIDDLLDDVPIQYREVMGFESQLFQGYFPNGMFYLEGGIESGFRKVKKEEYKPRLLQVKKTAKTIRALELPVAVSNMNKGDAFILDLGEIVYSYFGEHCSPFEKAKCGSLVHNLIDSRLGKSKHVTENDAKFWEALGGSEDDVPDASHEEKATIGHLQRLGTERQAIGKDISLFRLSDASGALEFKEIETSGKPKFTQLDGDDVFIVDAGHSLFIWVGKGASHAEKSHSMTHAIEYLQKRDRSTQIPISRICQGQTNVVFQSLFEF